MLVGPPVSDVGLAPGDVFKGTGGSVDHESMEESAELRTTVTDAHRHLKTSQRDPRVGHRRNRSLYLVVASAVLELLLILPLVDHIADANPTVHFAQHGLIFFGGVLMGIALRDTYRAAQS